jgi:ParB/RepB/Spo0J family partition protein
VSQGIRDIPLDDIIINSLNVRKDPGDLMGLTDSITEIGVQVHVHVRPIGEQFEVIAGSRRVAAARKAGLQTIPAIVHAISEVEAKRLSLVENIVRKRLSVVERVEGYKDLQDLEPKYHNYHELARATGQTHQKISQDFQAYDIRTKLLSFGIEVASDLPPSDERRQRGEVLPECHAVLVYQAISFLVANGVITEAAADAELYQLAKLIAPLPQAEAKVYIEAVKGRRAHPTDPVSQPVAGDQTLLWQYQPVAAIHGEDGGQVTCACCEEPLTLVHYGDGDHQVKRSAMHPADQQELPGLSP